MRDLCRINNAHWAKWGAQQRCRSCDRSPATGLPLCTGSRRQTAWRGRGIWAGPKGRGSAESGWLWPTCVTGSKKKNTRSSKTALCDIRCKTHSHARCAGWFYCNYFYISAAQELWPEHMGEVVDSHYIYILYLFMAEWLCGGRRFRTGSKIVLRGTFHDTMQKLLMWEGQ